MQQAPDHLVHLTGADTQGECLTWTHKQLHQAASRVASALLAKGVHPGSVVASLITNRAEWALLLAASVILPFTFATLDPGSLGVARKEELVSYMLMLKPDVVIIDGEVGAGAVDDAARSAGVTIDMRIALDSKSTEESQQGWTSLKDLAAKYQPNTSQEQQLLEKARQPNPDHVALILFTSGTSSGKPKGCPRHVSSMTYVMQAQQQNLPFTKGDRFLMSSANFRVIAPALTLSAWQSGAGIIIPAAASTPGLNLDAIERHEASHIVGVPTSLHALVDEPSFGSRKLGALKQIRLGGDMINKGILLKAREAFPGARIAAAHGMTEGGGALKWPFFDTSIEDIPFYGDISPLGKVTPGTIIRVWDVDNDCVAKRGEPGEFHLCSPSLLKHYLGGVNEDAFYDDEAGRWFKTGDLAVINNDGIFYILGRIGDRIKRAGVPITPAALESSITAFTGSQTTVFGLPHPKLGAEPFAVVAAMRDTSEEQIKQHVFDTFGKDYVLGGVTSLQQLGLDSFPLNATGKVMKITLRDHVIEHLNRAGEP